MSLRSMRNELRKLRKTAYARRAERYIQLLDKHVNDPRVQTAVQDVNQFMEEARTAAGRPLSWEEMDEQSPAFGEQMDRLLRALDEAEMDGRAALDARAAEPDEPAS